MKNNQDDLDLISRCISGNDKSAWEVFTRKYSRLIWNTISRTFSKYSYRHSQEDREDMFSNVFISLLDKDFKKLRQFRGDNSCSVSTWLSIITVHMSIDYMRKDKKNLIAETGEEDRDLLDLVPDNKYRADSLLENKQTGESLHLSLNELSPGDRMIYELLYNKGFSAEDTARAVGVSVAALYTKKHRIISRIKKNIKEM